ncbi:HU family DNA-binding protein [Enterococcus sp. N249-2]
MSNKVGKKELVEKIAEDLVTTKKEALAFLNSFEKVVKESITEVGDKVQLVGFLSLEGKVRAARTGRNPQTGEALEIPAANTVSAKAKFKF